MPYRFLLLMLVLCSLVLQAESCWYPGPFGARGGDIIDDPDARCTELPDNYLPGLDFIPGDAESPLWVVNTASPQGLLAFDVDELPPASYEPSHDVGIPDDSDGDGSDDSPVINGMRIESATLGLITAHSYNEVLFFDPTGGADPGNGLALTPYMVSVPGGTPPGFSVNDYPDLPAPGDSAESRTAISTKACINAVDLKNSDETNVNVPDVDDCGGSQMFYSNFTTSATVVDDKLFASLNNPDDLTDAEAPVFRPGTVLVFDFVGGNVMPSSSPAGSPSVIILSGYNTNRIASYTVRGDASEHAGKPFVLAISSAPVGTKDGRNVKVEYGSGTTVKPDAMIELIDANEPHLVKSVELGSSEFGKAALSGAYALDPERGILVVGSAVDRTLYSIDLDTLVSVGATAVQTLRLVELEDGSDPPEECPGLISGMATSDDLSEIYAVDYCAGTLVVLEIDDSRQLRKVDEFALTSPIIEPEPDPVPEPLPDEVVEPGKEVVTIQGPGHIAVRPGTPGESYDSSDLFVLVSLPEGRVCAQNVRAN